MAAFKSIASNRVSGHPTNMRNSYYVAVDVGLKNSSTAIYSAVAIASGLNLGAPDQMLGMGIHLCQHATNLVILHAELVNPLGIVTTRLVRHGHVLELSFLGVIDIIHCTVIWECAVKSIAGTVHLSLGLKFGLQDNHLAGPSNSLHELLTSESRLGRYNFHLFQHANALYG
jgi:hypothetical protein